MLELQWYWGREIQALNRGAELTSVRCAQPIHFFLHRDFLGFSASLAFRNFAGDCFQQLLLLLDEGFHSSQRQAARDLQKGVSATEPGVCRAQTTSHPLVCTQVYNQGCLLYFCQELARGNKAAAATSLVGVDNSQTGQ